MLSWVEVGAAILFQMAGGMGHTHATAKTEATSPDTVPRIEVKEARDLVQAGKALLVCAYDSDEKFAKLHLDGAISLAELKAKLPTLDKAKPIVFYCA